MWTVTSTRVCLVVVVQEVSTSFFREMANFKDDIQMTSREGCGVAGIGNLGDKTAILAQHRRQSLSGSRRTIAQHLCEDLLVLGNQLGF
jgi:hypothetical protein